MVWNQSTFDCAACGFVLSDLNLHVLLAARAVRPKALPTCCSALQPAVGIAVWGSLLPQPVPTSLVFAGVITIGRPAVVVRN